jgi:hypothetical protein
VSVRCRPAIAFAAALLASVANLACGAERIQRVSLNAVAIGALSRTDLAIGMFEARVAPSPHLLLTAAPTIVSAEGAETEHQLRAAATVLFQVGLVRFDDRNMWVFSDAGTTRYRNRLRLTLPVEMGGRALRFQLSDEVFYEQGNGWFRNLMAVGVGSDLSRSWSADAYWMRLDDAHRAPVPMVLVTLTVRIH